MRLLGKKATYLPGKLALRICPDFLSRIGKPDLLIGVTGTNGKTTVSNMLCDLLIGFGEDPVSNRLGSNIDAGAASALDAADRQRHKKRLSHGFYPGKANALPGFFLPKIMLPF